MLSNMWVQNMAQIAEKFDMKEVDTVELHVSTP